MNTKSFSEFVLLSDLYSQFTACDNQTLYF